jgi:hypothetical protein
MEFSRNHLLLLELANEDYYGLWDLVRTITSQGDSGELPPVETAKQIALELSEAGLIDVFVTDRYLTPIAQLSESDSISVLSDTSSWDDPIVKPDDPDSRYAVTTTEKGDRVYETESRPRG